MASKKRTRAAGADDPDSALPLDQIVQGDSIEVLASLPERSVDLVFADPPYSQGLGEQALDALLHGSWLAQDALIVVEEDRRAEFRAPAGFDELERRIKSDTELIFCTLS